MRTLVVFESMFGNTETIASAVAAGLAPYLDVTVVEVGAAPTSVPDDVNLLIVGGPTHAFGMTRPDSRRSAVQQAGGSTISRGDGIREWISTVELVRREVPVATFDTRVNKPRVPGSAARGAARRLRRRGARLIADPQSFYVTGTPGPLLDGEVDRARHWGATLWAALRPVDSGLSST
ncbi:MAG TPA: flavodoxin [Pilimelia sp.]|nr:flavodoxin [Pilimelia sp.]